MLFIGCGPPSPPIEREADSTKPKAISDKPTTGAPQMIVQTRSGQGTQFAEGTRTIEWKASWQAGEVTLHEGGGISGSMEGVDGTLYRNNREAARFTSQVAQSNRERTKLEMQGQVRITALDQDVTLTCDRAVFEPQQDRIRASGNVRITSASGTVETRTDILAVSDLSMIATPDLFPAHP